MTPPLRHWTRDGADDFERELIATGARELPTAAARRRAIAFLHGASATAVASAATAAASTTPVAAGLTVAAVAKWTGVGLVVGLASVGAGHAVLSARVPAAGPPAVSSAVSSAPPIASRETRRQAAPAPCPSVDRVAAPVTASTRPRAEKAPCGLGAELREIEAARAAIARGDLARGQRHLDAHAALPERALGPEAELLNLELMLARGQRSQAAARARAFLRASPGSPHAERVAVLLARAQDESRIDPVESGNGMGEETP
ncbi:MAG: hypothetical protein JW751_22140 [Polyangiaceae bacterium]|nr:hypothetical protein [Polyangiaceae bacterium]